jgi:hypothetical protein
MFGGNNTLTDLTGLGSLSSVGGCLSIQFSSLTSLTGLDGLISVGGYLSFWNNNALVSLTGMEALTSVGDNLGFLGNSNLPDCEICDLIGQITSGPASISVNSNLADTCTPVPANCP